MKPGKGWKKTCRLCRPPPGGAVRVLLDQAALSGSLGCAPERINPAALAFEAPFQMRRRGVELKLHLSAAPPEIAEAGGLQAPCPECDSPAFLAPDILERIASGEQPADLTTDFLIKTRFSALWSEQREQFSAL